MNLNEVTDDKVISEYTEIWPDGFCKKCGSLVIETASYLPCYDYMNTCTNPGCPEFRWHHVSDQGESDYYDHRRNI